MDREDLEAAIAEGLSVRAIAARHGVGYGTVQHWLRRHGLRTARGARLAATRAARAAGEEELQAECPKHGLVRMVRRDVGRFRCVVCRSEAVMARRRRVKAVLVAEAGGACCACGYDRYLGALAFHHLDPATKHFSIAGAGVTRSLDAARAEAAKCVLLCANCHAEVEAGVRELPSPAPVPG